MHNRFSFSFKNTFFCAAAISQTYSLGTRVDEDGLPSAELMAGAHLIYEYGLPEIFERANDIDIMLGAVIGISLDGMLVNFLKLSGVSHVTALKMGCGLVSMGCYALGKLAGMIETHQIQQEERRVLII